MYNILACDDEQIVIESLCFLFKKNFQDKLNIFTANSGIEALQIVNSENIDIIFMDINMPGITGLETIGKIMETHPDTVVIVLSAFDKFQYAQSAMNMGAFKYITKPVNRNVVIETVNDAIKTIEKRQGKQTSSEEIQKKLDIVSPMIENDFIYSCIFSKSRESEDLTPFFEYFGIQSFHHFFAVLEISNEVDEKLGDLQKKIRELAQDNIHLIMSSFMVNRLVLFFSTAKGDTTLPGTYCTELYKKLCLKADRKIRMGYSSLFDQTADFTSIYNETLSALNKTPADGGIECESTGKDDSPARRAADLSSIKHRIYSRLKIGDTQGVQFLTDLYFSELKKQIESGMDNNIAAFDILELLINAKNLAIEIERDTLGKKSEHVVLEFEINDSFKLIKEAQSPLMVSDYLKNKLYEISLHILNTRSRKENPFVKKACDYVAVHLSEDFSLEEVAMHTGVSQFYLSKLFREVTGQTFVNYIAGMRLDKARALLSETDFSVKEISAMCGYNDQNYFSKMYKSKFGVSPTEGR